MTSAGSLSQVVSSLPTLCKFLSNIHPPLIHESNNPSSIGLSAIGREIENPFGHDVNDLPLEAYCEELEMDIDTITAQPAPTAREFMRRDGNMPIWPLSQKNYTSWAGRSKQDIRDALMTKTKADMAIRKSFAVPRESESEEKEHHGLQQQHDA